MCNRISPDAPLGFVIACSENHQSIEIYKLCVDELLSTKRQAWDPVYQHTIRRSAKLFVDLRRTLISPLFLKSTTSVGSLFARNQTTTSALPADYPKCRLEDTSQDANRPICPSSCRHGVLRLHAHQAIACLRKSWLINKDQDYV